MFMFDAEPFLNAHRPMISPKTSRSWDSTHRSRTGFWIRFTTSSTTLVRCIPNFDAALGALLSGLVSHNALPLVRGHSRSTYGAARIGVEPTRQVIRAEARQSRGGSARPLGANTR